MMFSPYSERPRWLPVLKPSPSPTSRSREPTPQAMPNMVRNERSLCAQRVAKICAKMSITICMGVITREQGTSAQLLSEHVPVPTLAAFVFLQRRRVLPATGGVAPSVVPITRIASGGNGVHRQVLALKDRIPSGL